MNVCIHHDDEEGGCPITDDYIDQRTMFDLQGNKTVTLCCRHRRAGSGGRSGWLLGQLPQRATPRRARVAKDPYHAGGPW